METAALIFLGLSVLFFCAFLVFQILYTFDVHRACESSCICLIICLFLVIGFLITGSISEEQNKPKVKEYPLTEWRMDYKITTMDEKSDTTLVVTKIK